MLNLAIVGGVAAGLAGHQGRPPLTCTEPSAKLPSVVFSDKRLTCGLGNANLFSMTIAGGVPAK